MRSEMNLNFIKHFLAVYDFGSVTKAADHLNITQPSMSSAIKKFEESYGQPLFLKVGRSLEPTDAAHSLAYQVRPIMEQLVVALESPRRLLSAHLKSYCNLCLIWTMRC